MDDELVQEIRPLDPGRGRAPRRGPLAILGWAAALVTVVSVGLAGPPGSSAGDPGDASRDGSSTTARDTAPDQHAVDAAPSPRPILLDIHEPYGQDSTITTQRVRVTGSFAAPVRFIEVRLDSWGQHTLEKFAYRPADAPQAGRPVEFETSFDLPAMRPNGVMWIFAVGYNERGIPVDATRRRITIGELLDDAADPGVRPNGPTAGYAV